MREAGMQRMRRVIRQGELIFQNIFHRDPGQETPILGHKF